MLSGRVSAFFPAAYSTNYGVPFIHQVSEYLLSSSTATGAGDTCKQKDRRGLGPRGTYILVDETDFNDPRNK